VNVVGGHARLVSNGAIAGSTLLLEVAVRRAVCELGFSPVDAVEAATLTPAKAFGFDRPNPVTGAPIGLIAPGFAADFNLADPADWTVEQVRGPQAQVAVGRPVDEWKAFVYEHGHMVR
jgi:N-acetylglucosamine-6-phosphate deacetylase